MSLLRQCSKYNTGLKAVPDTAIHNSQLTGTKEKRPRDKEDRQKMGNVALLTAGREQYGSQTSIFFLFFFMLYPVFEDSRIHCCLYTL